MAMTPNQEAQKERARAEAEKHLEYSAVDRQRDADLVKYDREDAITNKGSTQRARVEPDANNAYPGEE